MSLNSVLAAPLVFGVKIYQRVFSPMSSPTCRFYPSCSSYAVTALVRFGPFRGAWLALRRIGRCNPWNPGGVDPVPQTWAGRGDVRPEDFRPDDSTDTRSVSTPEHTPTSDQGADMIDTMSQTVTETDAGTTAIRHDCRSVVNGERITHQTTEELR